jgi:hypothetical protein
LQTMVLLQQLLQLFINSSELLVNRHMKDYLRISALSSFSKVIMIRLIHASISL